MTKLVAFALVMSTLLALPAAAAAQPAAELRIHAPYTTMDHTPLKLEQYQYDPQQDRYTRRNTMELSTYLNTTAPDATLIFQAKDTEVAIYVECLTDIDGDGQYEWLDGGEQIIGCELSAADTLTDIGQYASRLAPGQMRTVSAQTLIQWGVTAERNRVTGTQRLANIDKKQSGEMIFCFTIVSRNAVTGEDTKSGVYYVRIDYTLNPDITRASVGGAAYPDVMSWQWYYESVDHCIKNGLLSGTSPARFSPDAQITRATLVQVLYNWAGSPKTDPVELKDVASSDWYSSAVYWAMQKGIVQGSAPDQFNPNGILSREQLAVVLYQYAQYQGHADGAGDDLSAYADGANVSSWARLGMRWCIDNGLLSAKPGDNIRPQAAVTRAELAAVQVNFEKFMG